MRTPASVSSVRIRLTGSWTGSSALQMQLDTSASVSQGSQVINTEVTNWLKSQLLRLLSSSDNLLTYLTLQERTALSTSMSVSLSPARTEALVTIRSMATPVHALLDF